MLSKLSVKKPMTIFVAVIIVLVLGFVSFFRMTPDLLPNMDLPYAMIMTAYAGQTPETVGRNKTLGAVHINDRRCKRSDVYLFGKLFACYS